MVVPVIETVVPVNLGEIKKFVGNNLQLRFSQNRCTMLVIGNNCSLKITDNFGVVKVIGNNCAVDITYCPGTVEYTGNNGKIFLDGDVGSDAITYVGLNGSLLSKKSKRSSVKSEKPTTEKYPSRFASQKSCGPMNYNFIRGQTADNAILVKDNVKIRNPCIKVNYIDINNFFSMLS